MKRPPRPQMKWFIYWLCLFGFVGFGAAEYIAIVNEESGDTLSESLRWLIYSVPYGLGVIAFVGFLIWFVPHILIGGRSRDEERDEQSLGSDTDDGISPPDK